MKVLITGHTGFVGKHLADLVHKEGHEVYGLSLSTGVDVRDYERVRETIEFVDPDQIHHLAAQAYVPESTTDPVRGFGVNLLGTLNLLEAVRHTGCRARVHITGTSEEYGYNESTITEDTSCRPISVYGVTKLAAGQLGLAYGRTYGIPVVHTRAFNHTGPGHQPRYAVPGFARRIAILERDAQKGRKNVLLHGNLEAVRDYTDVRDVVRAYRVAIDQDSGVYNVASGTPRPLAMIIGALTQMSSVDIELHPDHALYRPGMDQGNAPLFRAPASLLRKAGWSPEIEWHQTLRDTLDYWRAATASTKENNAD